MLTCILFVTRLMIYEIGSTIEFKFFMMRRNTKSRTTIEFKPSSSIAFKGGKFIDEQFVYPANHQFIVGTSKDLINSVIYSGTQNDGGLVESEEFSDKNSSAFYIRTSTGGSGYTMTYEG